MSTAVPEYYEPTMPLASIVASKTNPRTHFSESYIAELAGSVAEKGVIQPIVVRPMAKKAGQFEIVAGECRYRASKQAGLSTIPALVREYTDDQVLEVQLIENIHRHDLTPMEQARGYRRLIDSNPDKHSAATIATRIGMSVHWVWDRLKLNDLIPEAVVLLEADRISVGHAIPIARLKEEDQQRVVIIEAAPSRYMPPLVGGLWEEECAGSFFDDADDESDKDADLYASYKPKSVRELERWIAEHIRFDVEHAAKAQPLQFEDVAAKVEAAAQQPGRGKKVIPITFAHRVADDAKDPTERTYGSGSWRRADGQETSKPCDHSVLGLIVAGRQYGDVLEVCIARDRCTVHFAKEIRERKKAAKERDEAAATPKGNVGGAAKAEATRASAEAKRARERDAWRHVEPLAKRAIVQHFDGAVLTAKLLTAITNSYYTEISNPREVKAQFDVALTDENAVQVLALGAIADHEYGTPDEFLKLAKQYGIAAAPITEAYKGQLKVLEAAAKDAAKSKATPAETPKAKKSTKKGKAA